MSKEFKNIIGSLQPKKELYQPIAIGDIRTVSDEEWAAHWRQHGSGWQNPNPNNVCYLPRAYGGSDMGTIMCVSHFKTRLQLFHQKTDTKPYFTRNINADAKELGHLYETPTAIKYHTLRRRNGAKVIMLIEGKVFDADGSIRKNPDGTIFDEPKSMMMYRDGRKKKDGTFLYPWALANCDGLLEEYHQNSILQGILEIKTTSPNNYDVIEDWKNGVVPASYFYQCVYYMAILNVQFCDICCSWGQTYDTTAIIRIYRDYEVENQLFNSVLEFDEYVEQGIEPDVMMEDGTLLNNYYYELFGPASDKAPMVDLPEKYRNVIMRAIQTQDEIKSCEEALANAKEKSAKIFAELYPVFKNSTYGQFRLNENEVAGITLKTPMKRARFDEETFQKDYPALYEQCKVFSSTELNNVNKKLKKEYTLPAEPDFEDATKKPSFKIKITQKAL